MKKRVLAVLLAFCLLLQLLLPTATLAAGEGESVARVIGTSWTLWGHSVDYTYQGKTYTSADAPPAINRAAFRSMSNEDKQKYFDRLVNKSERIDQLGETGTNEMMDWWRSTNQYALAMRKVGAQITDRKFPELAKYYTVEEGQDWRAHYTLAELMVSPSNQTVMADNELIAAANNIKTLYEEMDCAWETGSRSYDAIKTVQREKIQVGMNIGSYLVLKMVIDNFGTPAITSGASYISDAIGSCLADIANDIGENAAGVPNAGDIGSYYNKQALVVTNFAILGYKMRDHLEVTVGKYNAEVRAFDRLYQTKLAEYEGKQRQSNDSQKALAASISNAYDGQPVETGLSATAPVATGPTLEEIEAARARLLAKCQAFTAKATALRGEFAELAAEFESQCAAVYAAYGVSQTYSSLLAAQGENVLALIPYPSTASLQQKWYADRTALNLSFNWYYGPDREGKLKYYYNWLNEDDWEGSYNRFYDDCLRYYNLLENQNRSVQSALSWFAGDDAVYFMTELDRIVGEYQDVINKQSELRNSCNSDNARDLGLPRVFSSYFEANPLPALHDYAAGSLRTVTDENEGEWRPAGIGDYGVRIEQFAYCYYSALSYEEQATADKSESENERRETARLFADLAATLRGLYPQYEEYYFNYNAAAAQFVGAVGQLRELYGGDYFAQESPTGTRGYFYWYDGQRRYRLLPGGDSLTLVSGAVDFVGITARLTAARENGCFAQEQAVILADLLALQQEEARLLHLIDVSRTAALEAGFLLKSVCGAIINDYNDEIYRANINELCGASLGRAAVTQFDNIEYASLCSHENYTYGEGYDANVSLDLRDNIPAYDTTGAAYYASNLADARDLIAGVTDESAQLSLRKYRLDSMGEQYAAGQISYARYISELQAFYSDSGALLESINSRSVIQNDPGAGLSAIVVAGIRADIDAALRQLQQTGLDYSKNDWQVSSAKPLLAPVVLAADAGGVSLGSRVYEDILRAEPTGLELVCEDMESSDVSRTSLLAQVDDLGLALADLDGLTDGHMYRAYLVAGYADGDGQPVTVESDPITFVGGGGLLPGDYAARISRLWLDAGQGQLDGDGFVASRTAFTLTYDDYAAAPASLNIYAQLPSAATTVTVEGSTVSYTIAADGSRVAAFSVELNKQTSDYPAYAEPSLTRISILVSAPDEDDCTYTLTVSVPAGQSSLPAAEFSATGYPGDLTMTVTGIPAGQAVWYCWNDIVLTEVRRINPDYMGPYPINAVLYGETPFDPAAYPWLTQYDAAAKPTFDGIVNGRQMTLVTREGEWWRSYQSPVLCGGIAATAPELTVAVAAEDSPGFYSLSIEGRSYYDTPYVRITDSLPARPLYGTALPDDYHQAIQNMATWQYHEILSQGCYLEVAETITVNTNGREQKLIVGWGYTGPMTDGLSAAASGLTVSAAPLINPALGQLTLSVSGAADAENNTLYYRVCSQQPPALIAHSRWTQGAYQVFTPDLVLNDIPNGSYIEVAEVNETDIPQVVSWGVSAATNDGVALTPLTLTAEPLAAQAYEKLAVSYTPYGYNDSILWRTSDTAPSAQPLGSAPRPGLDGWQLPALDEIGQTPTFDETGALISCTVRLLLSGIADGQYLELCTLDSHGRVIGWGCSGPGYDGYDAAAGLSLSLTASDPSVGEQLLTVGGASGNGANSIYFALRTYLPSPPPQGTVLNVSGWTGYDAAPKQLTGLYNGWYIEAVELNASAQIVAWGCSAPVANAIDGATRTYTVAFASGDGSIFYDTVLAGAALTPPLPPVSEYGEFSGWFTGALGGEQWDFSRPVTEAITLYAHWQPYSFRVSFNSMGGSSLPELCAVAGGQLPAPATPTRNKYSFVGWYTAPSGGELWSFDAPLTENAALYAHWQLSEAIVTLVCLPQTGGTLTMSPDVSPLKADDTVTFSTAPAAGYRLQALYWQSKTESGQITVTAGAGALTLPGADLTVTAEFERMHTLTVELISASAAPAQLLLDGVTQPAEFHSSSGGYSAVLTVSAGLHQIGLLTAAADGGLLLTDEINVTADTALTLSCPGRYRVSGTAVANGSGVSGVPLTLSGGGLIRHAVTGADGAYIFAALPNGTYHIQATGYALSADSVTLEEANITGHTLALSETGEPPAASALTLSQAGSYYYGQAPAGAVVFLCDADSGLPLRSATAENGFFRIAPESGDAERVQVVCLSEGQTLYSNIVSAAAAAELVSVSLAGNSLSFDNELGVFSGALYSQGTPFTLSAVFSAPVNANSAALRLAGNSYPATVNGSTVTAEVGSDWSGDGCQELTLLLDGESYALAWLTLLAAPSGVVRTADNTPLAGAQAVCLVLANNVWQEWDAAAWGQANPQITAADGSFGWSLPEGKYRVLVSCEGYLSYDSLGVYPEGLDSPLNTLSIVLQAPSLPIIASGDDHIRVIAPTAGAPGETVTVRFVPDMGYMLSDYSVSDNSLELTSTANGYSFIMPESQVTITATSALSTTGLISQVETTPGGAYVTVSLGNLDGNSLMIAAYDDDGKMVGVYAGMAENGRYLVPYEGTADKFSAFVIDPVSFAPQLDKITP